MGWLAIGWIGWWFVGWWVVGLLVGGGLGRGLVGLLADRFVCWSVLVFVVIMYLCE